MEYRKHVAIFVEKAAALDYFMTVIILYRFFPDFVSSSMHDVTEDFMEFFIKDKEFGLTFGRKITLFKKICEKKYPTQIAKYKHLTSGTLKTIRDHRNLLAHAFPSPDDNRDSENKKKYILTILTPNQKDDKQELTFNKMLDMERNIQNAIEDLEAFYKEIQLL